MAIGNLNVGNPKVMAASANVKVGQGELLGFFVSAASAAPTITVYDDAATGTSTPLVTVFTPAASTWYPIPVGFASGLYVVIGGTVSLTCVYV